MQRSRAVLVLVTFGLLTVPALGASPAEGHWDYLGEDGAVWVPAVPPGPGATYLPPADLGAYHNAEELGVALRALETRRPDLVDYEVAGQSVEGRDIHLVRIGHTDAPGSKPAVFYDGAHHGDEVIASEVLLKFAQELVNAYDSDARVRALVDGVELFIIPQVNPDGVTAVPTSDYYADARKNARGVDLNRNYPTAWGQPGASPSPGHPTYRGPEPLSEPESTAIARVMNARPFSFYLSAHSGADMILWPPGNTSAQGPEHAIYEPLGDRFTGLTGSPNGQVPVILYTVSGDSMDHAAFGLEGWRPLAFSPEVYRGSGSAYDWWYLFNPPDSQIDSVYAKWRPLLFDMAELSLEYGPATIDMPDLVVGGPDAFPLTATITASPGRPLLDVHAHADGHDALTFPSGDHHHLGRVEDTRSVTFDVFSDVAGTFPFTLDLGLGWQGSLAASTDVKVEQATIRLLLDATHFGAQEDVEVPLRFEPGPYLSTNGTVTLTLAGPENVQVVEAAFATEGAADVPFTLAFNTGDLAPGTYTLTAAYAFDGETQDGPRAVTLTRDATVHVHRPLLTLDKRVPDAVRAGEVFSVATVVTNVGDLPAERVRVHEQFPTGYSFVPRTSSLSGTATSPLPTGANVLEDGTLELSFYGDVLEPGESFTVRYQLTGARAGVHDLAARMTYSHAYASHDAAFEDAESHPQRVR